MLNALIILAITANGCLLRNREFTLMEEVQGPLDITGLNIAFTFRNRLGKYLDDPKYVRMEAVIYGQQGNEDETFGLHKCTNEDYDQFHRPYPKDEREISELKRDNALYCIDKESWGGGTMENIIK